jgi:hypothetical protein
MLRVVQTWSLMHAMRNSALDADRARRPFPDCGR